MLNAHINFGGPKLPPPHEDSVGLRIRKANAETSISRFARYVRSMTYDERGFQVDFLGRDIAICAKALLEAHGVLKDVTVFASKGRWVACGAWVLS